MLSNLISNNSDTSEPENQIPPINLDAMSEKMKAAVKRAGWEKLAPVQEKAIPYILAKRDLMVQAKTGSGKTGAFILPLLEKIDTSKNNCQAIVLVPTRELAQQVSKEAQMLAGDSGMRIVSVYGGTSYKPQIEGFKKGAHLVVGTPGRIIDHLIKRNLLLKKLKFVIFDEADRMMSMGFYPDMVKIQEYIPENDVTSHMFSATMPAHVIRLANQFLYKPEFLSLSRDQVHVEDTKHVYYITPGMDKDRSLVRIIEMENPSQAIIFCNTKDRVFYVSRVLQRFGYNADQISSDLSQSNREKVLQRVRDGKLRFLVATDVAARGIDIPELSHVYQFEPPDDMEAYIHRAGRTGRAGATGTAVMLINLNERKHITRLSARYKIEFEKLELPRDEDVQTLVSERLTGQLEARLRNRDRLQIERMQRFIPLAKELAEEEDGVSLLAMLLDDTYHEWMHKPPELPPITVKAPGKKAGGKPRNDSGRNRKGRPNNNRYRKDRK
ncbi:MAG: DEAD/DEAH box helicase [Chloroflexi bacterium]|jgi:ATP-dependent RNA helicase DeaD|nr:DEAD/DEAH box helicase [Chloroflexota bacterium]MBT4305692.1 DEAD/DEAH box helicase [Chloroflexota bacterium]MBT4533516.1 DEAD/DEAH box helicase [Chloroflexota bacterium]MBT4681841.1 DEAD/DEAH box helicase [Chloroflexota bacterium]MBT4756236.1 DEAD/DEAH box helicase [Chloroflexota bacterium]